MIGVVATRRNIDPDRITAISAGLKLAPASHSGK